MWRENARDTGDMLSESEDEEGGDAMKALEERTKESKQEMDILDALEEIKDLSARKANVDMDALIRKVRDDTKAQLIAQRKADKEAKADEADELAVAAIFGGEKVKRLDSSSDEDPGGSAAPPQAAATAAAAAAEGDNGAASKSSRTDFTSLKRPADKRKRAAEPKVGSLSADLGGLVKKKKPASSLVARKEPRIGLMSTNLASLVKKKGAAGKQPARPKPAPAAAKKPAASPGLGLGLVGNYSDSSESN